MSGISSKAVGKIENKYKFNGIEQNNDFDLNIYDAFYRNLDPQIGRFWEIDPKANLWESPYAIMENNPTLNVDPLGDTTIRGQLYEPKTSNNATTLKEVTVKSDPRPKLEVVSTTILTSCHIQKSEVALAQALWFHNITKDLDIEHGQVLPPRLAILDFFLGSREIPDPDYSPDNREDKLLKSGTLIVGSDGYIIGPGSNIKGGIIPIGFARGGSILSLSQRAGYLRNQIGKNSITINTVRGHIRYDLAGKAHNFIETPHKFIYTRHTGSNGLINFSKPKNPTPITAQDLRIIRNYLKSMK